VKEIPHQIFGDRSYSRERNSASLQRVALVELIPTSRPDLFAWRHFRHDRFHDGSANGRITQAFGHLSNLARILGGVFFNQLRYCCGSAGKLLHRRIVVVVRDLSTWLGDIWGAAVKETLDGFLK
jgi:hypothetical protein